MDRSVHQRIDDKKDSVLTRLNTHNRHIKPLLAFYEKKGILRKVDGNGTEQEVFDQIVTFIERV